MKNLGESAFGRDRSRGIRGRAVSPAARLVLAVLATLCVPSGCDSPQDDEKAGEVAQFLAPGESTHELGRIRYFPEPELGICDPCGESVHDACAYTDPLGTLVILQIDEGLEVELPDPECQRGFAWDIATPRANIVAVVAGERMPRSVRLLVTTLHSTDRELAEGSVLLANLRKVGELYYLNTRIVIDLVGVGELNELTRGVSGDSVVALPNNYADLVVQAMATREAFVTSCEGAVRRTDEDLIDWLVNHERNGCIPLSSRGDGGDHDAGAQTEDDPQIICDAARSEAECEQLGCAGGWVSIVDLTASSGTSESDCDASARPDWICLADSRSVEGSATPSMHYRYVGEEEQVFLYSVGTSIEGFRLCEQRIPEPPEPSGCGCAQFYLDQ